MDAGKEDMKTVGVTVEKDKRWGEMEADDSLWRNLKGAAGKRMECL